MLATAVGGIIALASAPTANVFTFHTKFSIQSNLLKLQQKLFRIHNTTIHAFVEDNCTSDAFKTCIPALLGNPSQRHAHILDHALQKIQGRKTPVLFVDGDVLPLPDVKINITHFFNYCILQTRGKENYCWPGMFGFVPYKMKGKSFQPCCGKDTGARTAHLIPPISRRGHVTQCTCPITRLLDGLPCDVYDKSFIHVISHTSTWRFSKDKVHSHVRTISHILHGCAR